MKLSEVRVPRRLTLLAVPAVVGAVALAGVVVATVGTRPTVRVTVEAREATTTVPITVVEPGAATDGDVPGTIREVTVEVTGSTPATGTGTVPGKASGTVRIENRWNQTQPLAATTRLLHESGVLFRTTARVDVPPGGSVEATVEADQAGEAGNVPPGRFTIVALWAGLQEQIFGTSTAPMSGGGASATVVADTDLLQAQAAARTAAVEAATPLLNEGIPPGLTLDPTASVVVAERTLERSNVGEVTATARVELRATVRGLAVDRAALERAVRESVAREYPGETVASLTTAPELTGVPLPGGPFPVAVSLELVPGSAAVSAARIAGRTPADATQLLQRIPGVATVRITGLPFWARTLPAADRIRILVDAPAP